MVPAVLVAALAFVAPPATVGPEPPPEPEPAPATEPSRESNAESESDPQAVPERRTRTTDDVLTRRKGPVYGVGAALRLPILIGDGKRVMTPVGFGAGLTFRVHALHLGPLRLGGMLRLGHSRFLRRSTVLTDDTPGAQEVVRWSSLGHTDFALGPSVQIVLGRIFLEGGAGVGVGISSLIRANGPTVAEEEDVSDVTLMVRGGGQIGVPIRNNQGVTLGVTTQKYVSRKLVVATDDLGIPDIEPNANPFDLVLDVVLGYQMWF